MAHKIIALALLVSGFFASPAHGQKKAGPDTMHVGVFLSSLYDLAYVQQSFSADFWLWTITDSSFHHPLKDIEFPSAKSVGIAMADSEFKHGLIWSSEMCKAVVRHQWNTVNFPFDVQHLKIVIEETQKYADQLVYVPDTANTKISAWIHLDGWEISALRAKPTIRTYATTYGDPEHTGSTSFPAIELDLTLRRHGIGLFFKLFSGVYIAFAIAMMVFFFPPNSEVRYTLAVGALFAAVANKYIIDSLLPATVGFTLVDKVHVVSFLYILGVVLFSGIAMHLQRVGKHNVSRRMDYASMWFLLVSYVAINFIVIVRAVI